jgi:hypothetical protein
MEIKTKNKNSAIGIFGPPRCGKDHLAKQLSHIIRKKEKRYSIVIDPKPNTWENQLISFDKITETLLVALLNLKNYPIFINEAQFFTDQIAKVSKNVLGADSHKALTKFLQSLHQTGHTVHIITQHATTFFSRTEWENSQSPNSPIPLAPTDSGNNRKKSLRKTKTPEPANARSQFKTLYLFRQSPNEAKTWAQKWEDPRIQEAANLKEYEYLFCEKSEKPHKPHLIKKKN